MEQLVAPRGAGRMFVQLQHVKDNCSRTNCQAAKRPSTDGFPLVQQMRDSDHRFDGIGGNNEQLDPLQVAVHVILLAEQPLLPPAADQFGRFPQLGVHLIEQGPGIQMQRPQIE